MIPGSEYSISFSKNEGVIDALNDYDGEVEVAGQKYKFRNASILHLAGLIASALGESTVQDASALKDGELMRLGKSLDQIVMARQASLAFQFEEFRKSTEGLFQQAAFRHRPTNKVVPTGPRHDIEMIDMDAYDRGEYEDGFLTHDNKFVNRAQAHKLLHGGQAASHPWEEVQSEDMFQKSASNKAAHAAQRRNRLAAQGKKTTAPCVDCGGEVDSDRECTECYKEQPKLSEPVKKADLPGMPAAPKAPTAPTAPTPSAGARRGAGKPKTPTAPVAVGAGGKPVAGPAKPAQAAVGAKQGAMPGKKTSPALPGLKVTKAESGRNCSECGRAQFHDQKFTGCVCYSALAKSVKTDVRPDGYLLTFGREWDTESIHALLETLKGE
jgi:hypothetical protein